MATSTNFTEAEVEVLSFLKGLEGGEVRDTDLFPRRDNLDNGRRRTLRRLCDKGVLQRSPSRLWDVGLYVVPHDFLSAYREWYRTKGFNKSWADPL